jgi:hypothetical protein
MDKEKRHIKVILDRYFDGLLSVEETDELFNLLNEDSSDPDDHITEEFLSLSPGEISYPGKNRLHKSYADISGMQFETLCIAELEGDLTPSQSQEIRDVLESDPAKNKVYKSFQKIRLEPEKILFRGKHRLRKHSAAGRIVRLAAIPLSIAASITVLITALNFLNKPAEEATLIETVAEAGKVQAGATESVEKITGDIPVENTGYKTLAANVMKEISVAEITSTVASNTETSETTEAVAESSLKPEPAPFNPEVLSTTLEVSPFRLAEVSLAEPQTYGNNTIRENIASGFREKILGEEDPDDSPLKGYEIAGAGINGINKLLGWEMNLKARKETTGEVNALTFNSKLITIQTPVKKATPDEQ